MIEWRGVFRWLCVSDCVGKGVKWKSQNDLVRLWGFGFLSDLGDGDSDLIVLERRAWEWEEWEWLREGFGAFFCTMSVRTDFSIGKRVGIDFNETRLVSQGNESKCWNRVYRWKGVVWGDEREWGSLHLESARYEQEVDCRMRLLHHIHNDGSERWRIYSLFFLLFKWH